MTKDYRKGQKVVATIELEDGGQDFLELDLLENGVLLGYSIMFEDGRRSLLGIGTNNGQRYYSAKEVIQLQIGAVDFKGLTIYMKDTAGDDPAPWDAPKLKYRIVKIKKAEKPNRFIKK